MALKMHAAVVEQFGAPLVLREWDVPSPGPGQIVVKTEACGVCHTDLHAAHGDWPVKPTLPFIPGHEAIGLVSSVGAGVKIVKEGDRVGVPWLYSACGHCEYCLKAWETVCPEAQFGGYTKNGGFAEYTLRIRITSPIYPWVSPPRTQRPSFARGSPLIRESNKPKQSPGNGLQSLESADWDILQSNMPKRWGYSSARSTSTTASSPMQSEWVPIWYSMLSQAIRQRL